ncbi:Os10g0411100 [Oryza sativa Japonica Group]|uniref:Os10g0411100 protein n=2 Tax=Oryza sativa subsp. japonica TaxID=39947 RepID=Q0IXS0_ORYSJ|nr:lipase, putative, expressed [Oryza sativa Japonica Group]BAF26495.1 Os10g0411100 [Oryza sativa Japonica Group]|eukprot:NP_001064581.1 Os10g0411100 [Oryza sativa Japonica Group]
MAPQLATLAEEPGGGEEAARARRKTGLHAALHRWARARIPLRFLSGGGGGGGVGGGGGGGRPSPDLRVLLSVLACPLSPVPVLPRHPRNVASSAQYILEQFRATTGCAKIEGAAKSMYAAGRVRMAMAPEPGGGIGIGGGGGGGHEGCFVVWQLVPDMWLVEMAVAGHAVAAGCDGRVAWRRTPWLDAHAARGGGARPLRRALQVGTPHVPAIWPF